MSVERFFDDAEAELSRAMRSFPPMHSAHEGFAVILEELDEFWEQVRLKDTERDPTVMRAELVQVAAMAARTALDVVGE